MKNKFIYFKIRQKIRLMLFYIKKLKNKKFCHSRDSNPQPPAYDTTN